MAFVAGWTADVERISLQHIQVAAKFLENQVPRWQSTQLTAYPPTGFRGSPTTLTSRR
ncbi:hypothetical protein M407DRAFT_32845 [Tulasnella calospora MUT 4182]|uniref:Uncharacterized protein n=1 Tax=Tulasnella calospora MUT 4182 TaxID=1051891 RepID=A0A0C3L7J9_9AGAM|nr:hypothetical protein M407DRAFT_32845 [Tulasnella calospora MUT 4182]